MADDLDIPPLEDMTEVLTQASAIRTAMLDTVINDKPTFSTSNPKDRAKVKKNVAAKVVNPEKININDAAGDHKTKSTNTSITPVPDISSPQSTSAKVLETSSGGMFGGMKKGFLFGGTAKSSSKSSTNKNNGKPVKPPLSKDEKSEKKKDKDDDLPYIYPKADKAKSVLKLDDVQQAMSEAKGLLDNQDWINDDLLNKVEKNELLLERFADPDFMKALQEFQTNPAAAMEKYKGNHEVEKFLAEFCNLLGDHFTKLGDSSDNVARSKSSASAQSPSSKIAPKISELPDKKTQPKIIEVINKSETSETNTVQRNNPGNIEKPAPKIVELTNSESSLEPSSDLSGLKTGNAEAKITAHSPSEAADIQAIAANDDASVKAVLKDSQVMEILLDPKIMNLIQLLKTDPGLAQRHGSGCVPENFIKGDIAICDEAKVDETVYYLKVVDTADADLKDKIKFLVSKGLLQFQS